MTVSFRVALSGCFLGLRRYGAAMSNISGNYEIGPNAGRVLVKTGREGLAAKVGHDLTIEITRWRARASVPDAVGGGLHAAALQVELDLGSLVVREGTGGAKPLSDKDRADIQATAAKVLGAAGIATYASAKFVPEAETIEGTLTLNGTARPLDLHVTNAGPGQFRGTTTIRQTDFGLTPYSGFLGALKLKDDIAVEFEVTLS
jgi:polyisoprenoid-binding protein YceI